MLQERGGRAAFSVESQLSAVEVKYCSHRCSHASAPFLTHGIYRRRMQRELRHTQTSRRTVTFCARSLRLRPQCGHRPLWAAGRLSRGSDSNSISSFNMEVQLQNRGGKGIIFHLLLETDVTFLRPVCFQDCGGLIFKTIILLQYVSNAVF